MIGRTALAYAARGIRILPLRERGKEPLVQHGVHDASCDANIVVAWWQRWPNANVGIAIPADWWALDVDPRNGGDVELDRLERAHFALPPTITATTGSGGQHILFARPPRICLRGKLGPGLDVLGIGRYILAAPSVHPSGGTYRWTSPSGTKIAGVPRWLEPMIIARDAGPTPAPHTTTNEPSLVERARRYLAACPPAISGSGGHAHTFVIAQKLVRGFELDENTAFALLAEWNRTCEPPWSARELAHKIKEARSRGQMAFGCLAERSRELGAA